MDFVTPWLAIGTADEAADAEQRQRHGIDAVLSLLPVDFDAGEAHLTLAVDDRVPLPATAIAVATTFLRQQEEAGRKTLMHCRMGISRSPALAACYLHERMDRPLAAALAEVRCARPSADPHPALLASIAAHYGETITATPLAIDLSANENPIGPSPLALAALRAVLPAQHRYPDRHGDALRRAIARAHRGEPAQVVLGNGSCEILDLAARAFLSPGESAIVAPPCFPAYRSATRRAHGRLVEVPLSPDDDFAYRLDRIAAAVDDSTRLIFLGNPNNPTGQGVAAGALRKFLGRLPPRVVVLLDEAYRDYAAEAGDADDAALADGPALVGAGCRLLVVRSFSKLHALAGLRIGYAFGPSELIAAIETLRPTYNTSSAAQTAALAALADRAHRAASRRMAATGRAALADGLAALGMRCLPSHGNFVLARCDRAPADSVAAGLAAAGIAVKPGSAFGLPDHLRISVGLPDDNRRLLAALTGLLATRDTRSLPLQGEGQDGDGACLAHSPDLRPHPHPPLRVAPPFGLPPGPPLEGEGVVAPARSANHFNVSQGS